VVNLVSKVFKVNAESVENLELKAPRVIAVSLVCKVFPAHLYSKFPILYFILILVTRHSTKSFHLLDCRAPKETEDRWVSLDLLANLENLDLKVLLAVTEALDLRALWDHLALAVLLVNLVNLVLPAPGPAGPPGPPGESMGYDAAALAAILGQGSSKVIQIFLNQTDLFLAAY
jgi:hypothetical protein